MTRRGRDLLTPAERILYTSIPSNMSEHQLATYFTMTPYDIEIIRSHRRDYNRIGFAVQLGVIRYLGWTLSQVKEIPDIVLEYISGQIKVDKKEFIQYNKREATKNKHLENIVKEYKYHYFNDYQYKKIIKFLYPHAMESGNAIHLIDVTLEELRKNKVFLPAISTIERIVWEVREKAEKTIFSIINKSLSSEQKEKLDNIIEGKYNTSNTFLSWLNTSPGYASPDAFLKVIKKLEFIKNIDLKINLNAIPQNRLKQLTKLGSNYNPFSFRRFDKEKRYAILVVYLLDLSQNLIDQAIEINDRQISRQLSKSKKAQDEKQKKDNKIMRENLGNFVEVGEVLLTAHDKNLDFSSEIEKAISWDELRNNVSKAKVILESTDSDHLKLLVKRFSYLRRYIPTLLTSINFKSNQSARPLLHAVEILKELNETGKRTVPAGAPIDFIQKNWLKYVFDEEGNIDRRYYEIAVINELKNSIRSGDISVAGSKKHKDFNEYLFSKREWSELCKSEIELAVSLSFDEFWEERTRTLHSKLQRTVDHIDELKDVFMEDGTLHIHRLEKDTPKEAKSFSSLLYSMIPRINLTDLLMEVSHWTDFDNHFIHSSTGKMPYPEEKPVIMATLIAMGTNIGLQKMADATPGISYRQMVNVAQWRMDEDTMKLAQSTLVNFHNQLHLPFLWGDGTTSSSDGMRVPIGVSALNAEYNPHYGMGRGTTFYRFTSDQFSSFYTKVINTNARDAIHVIDGLLHHDTNLNIEEHYTDTLGYTDQVFGLTHLLGFRFAPRLRDISDAKLYVIGKPSDYPKIQNHLKGIINKKVIQNNYDDVLRLAYSIRKGKVSGEIIMSKLGSYTRQNKVAIALREMGYIEKTIFLLDCIYDEHLQRRMQKGLNKGESTNALARALFFGKRGELKERAIKDQLQQATALNLLINAIVIWNTVYLSKAINFLEKTGELKRDLLPYVSPLAWEHINFLGEYTFDLNYISTLDSLRSLQIKGLQKGLES
jgi:TnpA family transposase